jgi:hypothetical protein
MIGSRWLQSILRMSSDVSLASGVSICLIFCTASSRAALPKYSLDVWHRNVITRAQWVHEIQREFIERVCRNDSLTIRCINKMTVTECASQLQSDIQICAVQGKLPPQIDRRKMSAKLAFLLGDCAGERIEKINHIRLRETNECASEGKIK